MALLILGWAGPSLALTVELRWTHPEPEYLRSVQVLVNGTTHTEPAPPGAPVDGIFYTSAIVPADAEVTLVVVDDRMLSSEPSNPQVYGDQCSDLDFDGNGVVGGTDFQLFALEWALGTAGADDFIAFRRFFGQTC